MAERRRGEDATPVDLHLLREGLADIKAGKVESGAQALRTAAEIQQAAENNAPAAPGSDG